jgi:ComF family protein
MPIGEGAACPYCEGGGIYPFERIVALGPFRDPLRMVIHQIKYHHRWPVAEILARQLLRQQRVLEVLEQTDRIVAVPLHWSRHIARGYNQAESVARRLKRPEIKIVRPIVRLKNTQTQTATHNRAQREENLRYAFGLINAKSIRGQRVTIVDDVMTTASTLKSAARAIREAKPASISAIVLAVADPRRHDFSAV